MKKMMMRTAIVAAIMVLCVMLLGVGIVSAAQTTDSDSHTVTFNNKAAIRLTVPETTYDFGSVDPVVGTFTSPANAVNPQVMCNTNWTLNVRGSGPFTSGSNSIPLSRLGWQASGAGGYSTMTTSNAVVATGTKTGNSGVTTQMGYQLTITFDDDVADNYTTTIVYTATTP